MLAQRHCCVHNMAYEIRNSNMYIKKNTLNVSEMARRDVRILNFVVVASTYSEVWSIFYETARRSVMLLLLMYHQPIEW